MNFSLIQNKAKLTTKYYKCITRVDAGNDDLTFKENTSYEYTLHSFARPDFHVVEVYNLFFASIYKKAEGQRISESYNYEDRLSIFFLTFCRHVFLHFLLSQEQKDQDIAQKITQQMLKDSKEEDLLVKFIKKKMKEMTDQYKKLMNGGKQRSFAEVQQIWKEMNENIENLIKIIEDQAFSPQSEHLPQSFHDKKYLALYGKRLFDRIRNIHILRRSKKKQMLELLYQQYCGLFSMKIDSKDSKEMQYKIYMTKNTTEREPILIMFPHYLKCLKDTNFEINYAIAKDVVKLFSKFLRQAKTPFPNLKLKSLLFNQRKVEPIYDQVHLIFDGLGMSGNTNTIELQIALNSTPTIIEYEKCHLEENEIVKWMIIKKYYQPRRKEGQEEDLNRSRDFTDENQKEANEKSILEKIHVWRLLCVLYSIFNINSQHTQLSAKRYADKYAQAPFFLKHYLLALEETYSSVQSGKISILKLLNLEDLRSKSELSDKSAPKQFHFTLSELCGYFEIEDDDDSMLQMLKYESFCAQFFLRISITKQISNIVITNPYFSRLPNIKKYIIGYFSFSAEMFYQVAFKTWLQQRQKSARKNFMIQCTGYRKINFQAEKQKMMNNLEIICKKLLEDYMNRKDVNQQFLMNNHKIVELVRSIKDNLKDVNRGELDLNERQAMFRLDSQSKEFTASYTSKLKEVKTLACTSFDLCIEMLEAFCIKEIDAKRSSTEEFHKIEDISRQGKHNKQLADIATHQLILLIQTYTRLRHSNWKVFERFVSQTLIERKNMSTKHAKRSIDTLQKEQIYKIKAHLNIIQTKIREYSIQKLNFGHENSWRNIWI